MTVLLLAGLTATFGWLVPPVLTRMRWITRTPRVGVTVWLCAVAAMSAAAVGAGFAATVPLLREIGGLQELIHRCPQWVAALGAHPSDLALAAAGATSSLVLLASAIWSVFVQVRRQRSDAWRYVGVLMAAGQAQHKVAVVPDPRPAAWSLAADNGHVVLTTAAVEILSTDELTAVVAHEHAHLRGRHHLLVALIRAARRAVPCPLTRRAVPEISELLEMRADDVAASATSTSAVASALFSLIGVAPAGALGAGGGDTAMRRLSRLLEPRSPARARGGLITLAALGSLALPITLTVLTTLTVLPLHFCPLP